MLDVAIIGGGLSGLSLASQLNIDKIEFCLFEARERFGGRILSQPLANDSLLHADLGPGWIWPDDQPLIADFVQRFGIKAYAQWTQGLSLFQTDREQTPQRFNDPASYADARRLEGGSQILVDSLLAELPSSHLHSGHILTHIEDAGEHVKLVFTQADGATRSLTARRVAMMFPPRLMAQHINFAPTLNPRLRQLMQDTPTWMASHAKAVLQYETPFWRQQGLSGSAFASYPGAMLGEIFDSSSADGSTAALAGFFALPAELREKYRSDLEALIIEQMVRLFGAAAARPLQIHIHDWYSEAFTATELDKTPPDGHPSYGHRFFQLDHWGDKLYLGGTETSPLYGGYLEGALQSAQHIAQQLSSTKGARSCQTA